MKKYYFLVLILYSAFLSAQNSKKNAGQKSKIKSHAVWLVQPSYDCFLEINQRDYGNLKGAFINEVPLSKGKNVLKFKHTDSTDVIHTETVEVSGKNQSLLKVYIPEFDPRKSDLHSHAIGGMVFIQGGTYNMGCNKEKNPACKDNEGPVHTVTLTNYYICKHEVTQEEWMDVMDSNPSYFKDCPKCPVENVSFHDIEIYLKKLKELSGIAYRLPTEAEWEYAARGGNKSQGYKFSGSNSLYEVAWYDDNSYNKGIKDPDYGTHPVALKKPNELGLYDMSGNVWEWCSDGYAADYYSKSPNNDPKGVPGAELRTLKGGSWHYGADGSRNTFRYSYYPDYKYKFSGFRLVFHP